MNTKKLLNVTVFSAILAMANSCGVKNDEAENKQDNNTAANTAVVEEKQKISIDTVHAEKVAQIEELTSTVKAFAKNDIVSQSPGRIIKIYCEVGDYVKKGQLLVKMDETSLINIKTQMIQAEADYNRVKALHEAGGASQQQVEQLKMQVDVMKENYNNLLENVNLTAPISGVITARNYDSGDMYKGGQEIVTINQMQPVKILVNVSEDNFTNVKKGQSVDVTVDALPGETFKGTIAIIYPTMDAATRTFPVEISINNPANKVRPGMFARTTFNMGTAKHVMVPDVAIQKQLGSGDHFVYTYSNGKVSYRKVETGRIIGNKVEIISGVEDGAMVVTAGMAKLTDGKEVDVVAKQIK